MDSKLLAPKFNANPRVSVQVFSKAIDDDKRSVASGQSANPLSPALFFESTTAKSSAEIGEAAGEKTNVEELCITARHQAAAVQKLEELMDQLEGVESDDAKVVADSVGTALEYLDVAVVHNKNMLDDYGQKWFHTLEQFETNRLLARDRNPELESIVVGPRVPDTAERYPLSCTLCAVDFQ